MAEKKSPRQYGSDKPSAGGTAPSAEEVDTFHSNADTDTRAESIHHTLGAGNSQASPGDHQHRGGDSLPLLTGSAIIGTGTDATVINSIIACLVALGAQDNRS